MVKKKNNHLFVFILILVALFFLSKQSSSKQVDVTYNYYDESGNLLGSGRESTVNGIPGVYYVRVVTNVKNTGTVPLRNISVTSASPAAVASAYSGVADVATLGAGATTTLTSGLINITQFEGSTVPVSIVIDSQYTTGDGVNSTVTYTGNTNLVVTPDTTPITGKIYYVSMSTGSDSNTGLTESAPIKTIAKANTIALAAGDALLFKRGDTWRLPTDAYLTTRTGATSNPILYGAYGTGDKPVFLGSIEANNPLAWKNIGGNIWEYPNQDAAVSSTEMLSNPSFDTGTTGWVFYKNSNIVATNERTTTEYDTAPAGYKISVTTAGDRSSDIQFSYMGLNLVAGKQYKLSFRAKGSSAYNINLNLIKATSPYCAYSSYTSNPVKAITTSWATYEVVFTSIVTASDGRITFYFGKEIPAAGYLLIDTISFKEVTSSLNLPLFTKDVGNIIFNNGQSIGFKKWSDATLVNQGDFYMVDLAKTRTYSVLHMYSTTNPASFYNDIELAMGTTTFSGKSNQVIDGFSFKYGAVHGIDASNVNNVVVRNNDFYMIGGALQSYSTTTGNPIRFGNCIQFGCTLNNIYVHHNKIDECYDAGLSSQAWESCATINSIKNNDYSYNIVTNSHYGWEYFNSNTGSYSENVHIHHNTLINSGKQMQKNQRPDGGSGQGMRLSRDGGTSSPSFNHLIEDNIVVNSDYAIIYGSNSDYNWNRTALKLDHNLYYGNTYLIKWATTTYNSITSYSSAQNKEVHGAMINPNLDSNYKPSGAACTMSSTGSYVGAVPC